MNFYGWFSKKQFNENKKLNENKDISFIYKNYNNDNISVTMLTNKNSLSDFYKNNYKDIIFMGKIKSFIKVNE